MRLTIKCVGVWLLFSAALTYAASDTAQKVPSELLIDTSYLVPALILPPPAKADSLKTKNELAEIKNLIAAAPAVRRESAVNDALTMNVGFFSDTIPGFNIETLPLTKALFEQVRYTEGYEAKTFKDYFLRKRPYVLDSDLHPCTATGKDWDNTSYPSGHTTMAYSMGIVLANLIPEQSAAIMKRAEKYAESRIICGVHYRSDITAGQVLGSLVAVQLLQNDVFQKQMAAAKDELRAAGLTD